MEIGLQQADYTLDQRSLEWCSLGWWRCASRHHQAAKQLRCSRLERFDRISRPMSSVIVVDIDALRSLTQGSVQTRQRYALCSGKGSADSALLYFSNFL